MGGPPSLCGDLVVPERALELRQLSWSKSGTPCLRARPRWPRLSPLLRTATSHSAAASIKSPWSPPGSRLCRGNGRCDKAASVTFRPDGTALVVSADSTVELGAHGQVTYNLVWAGCWCAVVAAESQGFVVNRVEEAARGQVAFEIMAALARNQLHQGKVLTTISR